MKTTKSILFTVSIISFLVCSACESFTEVDTPQSQLTTPAVFENTATADGAMTDIYARMREEGMVTGSFSGLSSLMSNYSDEMQFFGSSEEIKQFNNHTILPSNSLVLSLWNASYSEIYATNLVLEGLKKSIAITLVDKQRLTGEALFLRAFIHFNLLNVFGDVPYVTTTDYLKNTQIQKFSQEKVFQHIIEDLIQAEVLLPPDYPTAERIRANKAVATAMLARVYLYKKDWTNAAIKATAVIENPTFVWVANPALEFLRESKAIIWALHPGFIGANTKDARTFVFSKGPPTKPALSPQFVASFEPGDQRRSLWIRTVTNANESWSYAYKYKKTLGSTPPQEYTILFRLAEQHLIRAEALAHLNNITGSQADINKIRKRAGLLNTSASDLESLLNAVAKERRSELFTEQGHRWFDLKRTGQAQKVLEPIKSEWKNTQILLPIPQSELLLNKNLLPQNPGY